MLTFNQILAFLLKNGKKSYIFTRLRIFYLEIRKYSTFSPDLDLLRDIVSRLRFYSIAIIKKII